jgi:bifunctional UDP-N-acetylglucosamine pyrophosphorylase/glucosamine-1-phosphate N-acetyltransferase
MSDVHLVVLAAGKGTRMKSSLPKVLHQVAGRPMIDHVLTAGHELAPSTVTVVTGFQADRLQAALAGHSHIVSVVQEPQLGTAHALLATAPVLEGLRGILVLLSGDVPLLRARTLETLVARHRDTGAAATLVTAVVPNPGGYGRVVRSGEAIARIVEDRDASAEERAIREINAGVYAFELDGMFDALRAIAADNAQGEYYLPDLVAMFRSAGRVVETVTVEDADEILGVNSRSELAEVSRKMREAKCRELMAAGVTIEDPATTYIDGDVRIGIDTIVKPGVTIEGQTTIGAGCEIHSGVRIASSAVGDGVHILDHCLIDHATIQDHASVGPFAHLRANAVVGVSARVGNFVELKKSVLGDRSKAMHLSYLGDATIGTDANIGAGTITCNYDGVAKHQTTIEDGAFVGSDTQLIAPVTIGAGAYVGTGTTVREDVPPGALAVSAGKQRNIEGWVAKRRKKSK